MSGTSDQQKVREIAEDAIREGARTASIEDVLIGHPVVDHDDPESDYDAWFDAIAAQMPKAIVTVSWPDEQPQDAQPGRDGDGDVRAVDAGGYSITWDHYFVRLWCVRCPDGDDPIAAIPGDPVEMSRLVAEMRDHSAAHAALDAREAKASER